MQWQKRRWWAKMGSLDSWTDTIRALCLLSCCLSNLFLLLLLLVFFNDVKESYGPRLLFLMILSGIYCQRSIKNCASQIENHLCEMPKKRCLPCKSLPTAMEELINQSSSSSGPGPGTVARECKESKAAASSFQVINICEGVYSSHKQHSRAEINN